MRYFCTRPLNTPYATNKCMTDFKRTRLSSSSAMRHPSLASAFVGEAAVHLSFIFGVLRGLLYNYLTFITSLIIHCDKYSETE